MDQSVIADEYARHEKANSMIRKVAGWGLVVGVALLFGLPMVNDYTSGQSVEQSASYKTVRVEPDSGHGSGVVIGNGVIVTNQHVVDKTKDGKVSITFANGDKREGKVLWKGVTPYDLALIRVDTQGVQAATIDCSISKPGREVFSHGHPMKFRDVTTWGRVASKPMTDDEEVVDAQLLDLTVTSGNSGGGVWATELGKPVLVGIATAIVVKQLGFGATQTGHSVMVPASALCRALART